MSCPKCGGPLKEILARVHQPMPFSRGKRLAKKGVLTSKRRVYECDACERTFIRTIMYKEVQVLAE